jgi:hypothetical protein
MSQDINLGGTIYISSRRGADKTGYTQDYVGQLARSGAIEARRVSGLWYVEENSLLAHKKRSEQYVPTPPQKARGEGTAQDIFLENGYISASRASKISGYSADYVTQLAREQKIKAHQEAGNRWFVEKEGLLTHKKEKDSLLAVVQAESVGIRDIGEIKEKIEKNAEDAHFSYFTEKADLIPTTEEAKDRPEDVQDNQERESDPETQIPIRIMKTGTVGIVREERSLNEEKKGERNIITVLISVATSVLFLGVLSILMIYVDLESLRVYIKLPVFLEDMVAKELLFSRETDF